MQGAFLRLFRACRLKPVLLEHVCLLLHRLLLLLLLRGTRKPIEGHGSLSHLGRVLIQEKARSGGGRHGIFLNGGASQGVAH